MSITAAAQALDGANSQWRLLLSKKGTHLWVDCFFPIALTLVFGYVCSYGARTRRAMIVGTAAHTHRHATYPAPSHQPSEETHAQTRHEGRGRCPAPASRRTRSRACARSLPAMLDSPPAPATPLTPA